MLNKMNFGAKRNSIREERELKTAVSFFLLGKEELSSLFWNIKSVRYNKVSQNLSIGINTIDGKLGTTLNKLRKTCKELSLYLYQGGYTFKKAHINFFVDKNDQKEISLKEKIDKISETLKNKK